MTRELKNFGLYGREEWTVSPEFFHLVTIDASCRKHNWVIKPHFHSKLYQFFFIESGSGTFIFNEKSKQFSGRTLIIMPDNNLHGFQFSEDVSGYTLSISSYIIEKITESDTDLAHEINQVRIINLNNNKEGFEPLLLAIRAIEKEIALQEDKMLVCLESLLQLLLVRIFRLSKKAGKEKVFVGANRELGYYRAFLKKIKGSTPTHKNIEDYAKELGISKTHLNRVCQATVGKSTKQVISTYLINEIMILLAHTELTISEIAHQFEFNDVSYFCRFFKAQAGVSPAKFREDNLNIEQSDTSIALNF